MVVNARCKGIPVQLIFGNKTESN